MDTTWRPGDDRRSHPLHAWLGPAVDQLTDDQLVRIAEESGRIDARYPDPDDQPDRDAALSAVVQYLLGDMRPADFGREYQGARAAQARAYAASQQAALMLIADGVDEAPAARDTGIDRMTLRKLRGKR